nr:uncharacterized protein LOC112029932 [Quercus suber]
MSIGAPVIRSHRNCALPRLMNAVFESGYRLKNMINFRAVRSGANFAVPMDVPLLKTHGQAQELEQNGVVERNNKVIQETTRAMLHNKDVARNLWGEVVNTACHTDRENVGNFDSRSDEGIFLGYSSTSKAYRVYNKRTMKVMETVNVVIDDSLDSNSEKGIEELPKEILHPEPKEVQDIAEQEPASLSTPGTPSVEEDSADIPTSPDSESHLEKGPFCRIKLNHPPEVKPTKVEEALQDESWVKAMHDELL